MEWIDFSNCKPKKSLSDYLLETTPTLNGHMFTCLCSQETKKVILFYQISLLSVQLLYKKRWLAHDKVLLYAGLEVFERNAWMNIYSNLSGCYMPSI